MDIDEAAVAPDLQQVPFQDERVRVLLERFAPRFQPRAPEVAVRRTFLRCIDVEAIDVDFPAQLHREQDGVEARGEVDDAPAAFSARLPEA